MAKTKPKYSENTAIRGALRRAFARCPLVQEKMQESRREVPRTLKDGSRAKRDWVQRQCEVCSAWVGSTKIAIDHIEPVISVSEGFTDWNDFISRLWCPKENLQRICDTCHNAKTNSERITRLTKQYTLELDELEANLKSKSISSKDALHALKKYLAKKKTVGLSAVVERACSIKKNIKT